MATTGHILLATDRLLLRELQEDDWRVALPLCSDEDTARRFMVNSRAAADRDKQRQEYHLAVALKLSNEAIGGCNLMVTSLRHRHAKIGYYLNREQWGQGYATEAVRPLLRFGFDRLALHRITATCGARNTASWRVLEKVGMRQEGHEREVEWVEGEWRDRLLYAILDHEWKARNA